MAHLIVFAASFLTVVTAVPMEIPEPARLAFIPKNSFEDQLNSWLEIEDTKHRKVKSVQPQTGCVFNVNGDLGQPQPVYLHHGNYLVPTGTTGQIQLNAGEPIIIACPGPARIIRHPNITASVATAATTCVNNALVYGAGWLAGLGAFGELTCSSHPAHEATFTNDRCHNNNLIISVGYTVYDVFYPLYWSCFDQDRFEVLYVWYEQNPPNAVNQANVARPGWTAGSFYPGVPVNTVYSQAQQKATIADLVGRDLADKYITELQYLARGHLAAKTDFIYASGQRATFYFINAAPQWQPINAGNWNWIEQDLRDRVGKAGYSTVVYTGTFGVTQLRDASGSLVDIYLHRDANNNPQIPVPLYYYKMVFDASRRKGTVFVTINNPHYTKAEVLALVFCPDQCRNNSAFSWLNWQPDRIDIGYSFCCTIDDFRKTVPHLPMFIVDDLLT